MKKHFGRRLLGNIITVTMLLTLFPALQVEVSAGASDSLIFYVDAKNNTGNNILDTTATTWKDLSGKNNDMTLKTTTDDYWTANGWRAYNNGTGTITNETTLPQTVTDQTFRAIANGGSFTFEFITDDWSELESSTPHLFQSTGGKTLLFHGDSDGGDNHAKDRAVIRLGGMYQTSTAAVKTGDMLGHYNSITVTNLTTGSTGDVGTSGYMEVKWYVDGELKSMAKGVRGAGYSVGTNGKELLCLAGFDSSNGPGNSAVYKMMKLYTTALTGADVRANVNAYYSDQRAAAEESLETAILHRYYYNGLGMIATPANATASAGVILHPKSASDILTETTGGKIRYTSAASNSADTGLRLYMLYNTSTAANALSNKKGKIWHISWKQTPTTATAETPQTVLTQDNTDGSATTELIKFGSTVVVGKTPTYNTSDGNPIECVPTKEYKIDYVLDYPNNVVRVYLDNVLYATTTHTTNTELTVMYNIQWLVGSSGDLSADFDDISVTTYNAGYITDTKTITGTATLDSVCAIVTGAQDDLASAVNYTENTENKSVSLIGGQRDYNISLADNTMYTTVSATPISNDYTVSYYVQDTLPASTVVGSIQSISNTGNAVEMMTMRRPAIGGLIPIKNESTKAILELTKAGIVQQTYTVTFNSNQPSLTSLTYPTGTADTEKQIAFIGGAAMNNDSGTVLTTDRAKIIASNVSDAFVGGSTLAFPFDATDKISTWDTAGAEYFKFKADTAGTIYIGYNGVANNYKAGSVAAANGWSVVQEFSDTGSGIIDGEDPIKSVDITDWRLVDKSWNSYTSPKYFYNATEWYDYNAADVRSDINTYYFEDLADRTNIISNTRKLGGFLYSYTFNANEEVTIYTPGTTGGQMAGVILWDSESDNLTMTMNTQISGTELYAGVDVYGEVGTYEGIVLFALYDSNNSLLKVSDAIDFTGPATEDYVSCFDTANITGNVTVKAFVWENMSNLKPLIKSKSTALTLQ